MSILAIPNSPESSKLAYWLKNKSSLKSEYWFPRAFSSEPSSCKSEEELDGRRFKTGTPTSYCSGFLTSRPILMIVVNLESQESKFFCSEINLWILPFLRRLRQGGYTAALLVKTQRPQNSTFSAAVPFGRKTLANCSAGLQGSNYYQNDRKNPQNNFVQRICLILPQTRDICQSTKRNFFSGLKNHVPSGVIFSQKWPI